jgi:hypothetical protein
MKANIELQREVGLAPASEDEADWHLKRPYNEVLYKVSVLSDGTIVMDDGVNQIVQPPVKRRSIDLFIERLQEAFGKLRSSLVSLIGTEGLENQAGRYFNTNNPLARHGTKRTLEPTSKSTSKSI